MSSLPYTFEESSWLVPYSVIGIEYIASFTKVSGSLSIEDVVIEEMEVVNPDFL